MPAEADIVCYWFEKARALLQEGRAKRAGLLATQGIRGGANRRVLQRIKESGDVFFAWSDQPVGTRWLLPSTLPSWASTMARSCETGIGRDHLVESINANLTGGADLTAAQRLNDNLGIAFMGDTKGGPFDIPESFGSFRCSISPNPRRQKSNS